MLGVLLGVEVCAGVVKIMNVTITFELREFGNRLLVGTEWDDCLQRK